MRRIYLVRHGEIKKDSELRKCLGQTDMPLAETAIPSSKELGQWFREKQQNKKASIALVSGSLMRAYQTAKYIQEGAGDAAEEDIIIDNDFNEVFTGLWENREFAEIRVNDRERYEERGKSLGYFRFPEGESIYDAGARFERALNRLRCEIEKDMIIVSHSGAIRAFLCKSLGISIDEYMKLGAANLSMSILLDDGENLYIEKCGYKPPCLLDDTEINSLYNKYKVPQLVIAHMKKTAEVVKKLMLYTKRTEVDWDLVEKAALVHDLLRVERQHALKGAEALRREGYYEIAELVEKHHDAEIQEEEPLTEAEILFYADARVKEDKIVSVEERYQASNYKCHCIKAQKKHDALYRKAKIIEKKIFGGEG